MISQHTAEQAAGSVLVDALVLALERIWHGNEIDYLWLTRFPLSLVLSQSFSLELSTTQVIYGLFFRAVVLLAQVNQCTNKHLQISGTTSDFKAVCNNCYRLALQ